MMRRLIEYSANCVSIPARIAGIPSFVCRKPVHRPVSTPTTMAMSSAAQAGIPASRSITATAPPVANEPSTVISGISSSRKVINTPSAMSPHMMPCATAAGILDIRFVTLRADR